MLAFLAFLLVVTFMALIMTRRLSALVALMVVPVVFALIAGRGDNLGDMMMAGVRDIAPTGVMLLFAILYFGLMIDTGLFNPLVAFITRRVQGDPVRVLVGTALMALLVSLDGDGTTTYMITVSALLPVYRAMGLDVRKMACIIIMAAAITNLTPWGGPTARAASALKLDPADVFLPLIPAMVTTAIFVLGLAYLFGVQEKRRLAGLSLVRGADEQIPPMDNLQTERGASSQRMFWFNLSLTIALMGLLVSGKVPLAILFMLAFSIALMINYPGMAEQRERIGAHAANALSVVSLIFAAGIFVGILSGTGMLDEMGKTVLSLLPPSAGPYLAPITAVLSIPFTFFISNDAFYFGILPVLAAAGAEYGIPASEIARASLIGQQLHLLSPLVPSTYLLVGLVGIELGDHQKFTLKWALGACGIMLISAMLTGAFAWSVFPA